MTRYGKTFNVAAATILYVLMNKNKRVLLIAPSQDQTKILRNYIAKMITDSEVLSTFLSIGDKSNLESEVSRRRLTFVNGSEVMTLSAHGSAEGLMGWGGDMVVCHPYNTLITTDRGDIPIGKIVQDKIKCKVLSRNQTGELEFKKISRYFENGFSEIMRIKTANGQFECTPCHPVYVRGEGYVEAKSLKEGDELVGLCKDLNMVNDFQHSNDKRLRILREGVLHKTQPLQEGNDSHLFKRVSRRNVFQDIFSKSRGGVSNLWKRIFIEKKCNETQKEFLLNKLSCDFLFRKQECKVFSNRKRMSELQSENKNDTMLCKKEGVLLNEMQGRVSFKRDELKRQSKLEGGCGEPPLLLHIQPGSKKTNKRRTPPFLRSLWDGIRIKSVTHPSYRLRQTKFFKRKLNPLMSFLSWKNTLSKRSLENATIVKIEKLDGKKQVYNVEVQKNHNYFSDGFLTHNCDESCLIEAEVYRSRISRMLGDNPNSVLVELSNPWNRNNHFYEHWISPLFYKIHVGFEIALKEGRITEDFLQEQKDELTPLEFQVLYHSDFPDEAEDQLIAYSQIQKATKRYLDPKQGRLMISCDVADKGLDKTVIMVIREFEGHYVVLDIFSEDKSENIQVSARLLEMQRKWNCGEIFIDCIGIGAGVLSAVKSEAPSYCKVNGCHFGVSASNKRRFRNKKAEMYFKLKKLFEEDRISIPDHPQLIRELSTMGWEQDLTGRIKIVDPPQKSPDFADCLCYGIWDSFSGRSYNVA